MNIRPATQNDLEQIVEIFNQAIENGNSNAYTEKVKTSEKTAMVRKPYTSIFLF